MNGPKIVPKNMSCFSNTRAKRSTAFAMSLVWLFAVVSGVANACLLERPAAHSHLATGEVPAEVARHVGAVDDPVDEDSGTSKASCLKVCEERSNAPVKLHPGFDLTDPGLPTLVAIVWTADAPVVSGSMRLVDLQPSIAGPPLRVRYSRLAL
jgi:hypothetical protein